MMPKPKAPEAAPKMDFYQHETDRTWLGILHYNGTMIPVKTDTRGEAEDACKAFWKKHTGEGKAS